MGRTPSRDVEEGLLRAAEQILAEEGPGAITVRRVANCAGVAPMGVYNRFEGKQGLLEALFIRGFRELRAAVGSATGSDAFQRLREGCVQYREFALAHPEHYRLMFERMHEVAPGERGKAEALAAFDQLVANVAAARAAADLGRGCDVEVAQQLWSALHGAVSLELLGIGFGPDPAAVFTAMLDALLAGMLQVGAA